MWVSIRDEARMGAWRLLGVVAILLSLGSGT